MTLFTQSTAILHKYLNDERKIVCFTIFPEVAQNSQNSLSFPCSEKSLSGHPIKSVYNCLSNLADRQTDRQGQKQPPSFGGVFSK